MKNLVALTGVLLMSLLTSAALAGKTDPSDKYLDSESGTVKSGVIKSLRDCPVGTDAFFKNVNPFISGGPGGSSPEFEWQGNFLIDGTDVTLFVYWKDDNSFRFVVQGGVMQEIGAEVDSDKLIYEYQGGPVFRDGEPESGRLNVLKSGEVSAAVNHLDICLSLVDTTKPFIEFLSPKVMTPPAKVSGAVSIIVRVTDESGVDSGSVAASVYQGDVLIEDLGTGQLQADGTYTWEWITVDPAAEPPLDRPAGIYTIEVTAADLAIPAANTATVEVTVELVKLLSDCFGILGDEDFDGDPADDGYANGCEPTPLANVQVPPDTDVCNVDNPPDFCFIAGRLLKPNPLLNSTDPLDESKRNDLINLLTSLYGGCDACVVGYCGDGLPDPRMVKDTSGNWEPRQLMPLTIADVAEGTPPGVLGKYVYGYKGCFTAAQHFRGGELFELYPTWPQDDPDTPDIDEATGLVFVKKHSPEKLLPDGLDAPCAVGTQNAAQAGYQPLNKLESIDTTENGIPAITLAATQKCNAPRTLSRDNGIDVSNIIETDGSDDPLAFKYQMAQMQFDALFVALECAEPTFLRRGQSRFSNVSSPINQAKAQFDNGTIAALERARDDLNVAADAIRTSNWNVTAENCAGDALARTENLAWRMTDLICASTAPGTGDCEASPYP